MAIWRRGLRLLLDASPLLLLVCVFLAAFVLDSSAVARLAWNCAAGAFGTFVQVAVSAGLLSAAAMTAWAFWPETRPPPRRRATVQGATRRRTRSDPEAPGEVAPEVGRGRRPSRGKDRAAAASPALPPAASAPLEAAAAIPQPRPPTAAATARGERKPRRRPLVVRPGTGRTQESEALVE
jgi:hypothetical protein